VRARTAIIRQPYEGGLVKTTGPALDRGAIGAIAGPVIGIAVPFAGNGIPDRLALAERGAGVTV
jgi:hypothetical protein